MPAKGESPMPEIKCECAIGESCAKRPVKILITDNVPLYPAIQGGPLRIYNLYNPLPEEQFEINYIGAASHNVQTIAGRITDHTVTTSKSGKINMLLVNVLGQNKKYLRGGSLYDLGMRVYLKFNRNFLKKIYGLANSSDILISSHPWFFTFIKRHKGKVLVYDSHNCEYELLRARMSTFWQGRLMLFWTKAVEKEACLRSDLIIACSDTDKSQLCSLYSVEEKKIAVVPNSVDTSIIKPASDDEKRKAKQVLGLEGERTVLFTGTNYFANNSAADFVVDSLAKDMPDFKFLIVGSIKTYFDLKAEALPGNVILFGRISDEKFMNVLMASDYALNPVELGSGICIKSLYYLAAGIPVISTPVGMRGISQANEVHALICGKEKFKDGIARLQSDVNLYRKLVRNGRDLVEREFDVRVSAAKLSNILDDCYGNGDKENVKKG
jgi:glycosyltransferase involved in cell wall biosynthesis